MLPGYIALPCPRCARAVPLFSCSISSTEMCICLFTLCASGMYNSPFLVPAAGLRLCLAAVCCSPGWSSCGAGCRAGTEQVCGGQRWRCSGILWLTLPVLLHGSCQVFNIRTIHSRVDLCLSPPSNPGKCETFEITLLDLFEVKIFSLRVNINFHLDV